MNNAITDYTFTVIEDNMIPLAATVDTVSYLPVILAVAVMGIIAIAVAYVVWFVSHRAYIANLTGNSNENMTSYFIHPGKLLQREYELENSIADQYIA